MTLDGKSDAQLITAVRGGDTAAYGMLYERHLYAAKRAATCLASSAAEREDLVADAFTKVLRALRGGGGPNEEFRAYLLVTMRNAAISSSRGATVSLYADVPETYLPRPGDDPVMTKFDTSAAAAAFASLPERWRTVLWHTEVEDESPAQIAPLLGMRPNGVAALAYRAREGLRQAYLRAHLPEAASRDCQATVAKLAGFVRRSVPVPLGRKITQHLAACADCRDRAETLNKVNEELRASVAPLLLGASFAAAYLPTASTGAVAKTMLAKIAAVVVVTATAAATVASTPPTAVSDPLRHAPTLADPSAVTTATIQGPPPAPSFTPPAAPPATVAPAEAPAAGTQSPESDEPTAQQTDQEAKDAKAQAKQDAKAQAKADKAAAKEEKKQDKAQQKDDKAAEKAEKKANKGK